MEFDFISSYTNFNRTAVKKGDKWGFIDKNSEIAVPIIYDSIKNFQNGFAEVCINHKWGFVDLNGTPICELKYSQVYPFDNGYAIVYNTSGYNLINQNGKEISKRYFSSICKLRNGDFCLVDKSNKTYLFSVKAHKFITREIVDNILNEKDFYECYEANGSYSIKSNSSYTC
ncbi:MAG: WG repeat-containing protein [Clostridia bacterium]|nr:WG repeat-containing protein [Clostridia bacterium]